MKIYIDNIVFDLQEMGGISVYFAELISRLVSSGLDVRFIEQDVSRPNVVRKDLVIPGNMIETERNMLPRIARYRPIRLTLDEQSVVHSSYYRTCYDRRAVNIVTVYDFTYEYFRNGMPKYVHSYTQRKSLDNADGIICISGSTKADLLKLHGDVDPDKIEVIHLGASREYAPSGPAKMPRPSLGALEAANDTEFVLFVGARAKYKNFLVAVEALSRIQTTKLAIVGGGELSRADRRVLDKKLAGRYVFLRSVTTSELNSLYNRALCLLYPSSYEGFGIPVVEAMQAGCPVVAANRSSIPEVAGSACLLIESIDADDIVDRILSLRDPDFRNGVIKAGLERAKEFSWDKTFHETVKFYEKTMLKRRK